MRSHSTRVASPTLIEQRTREYRQMPQYTQPDLTSAFFPESIDPQAQLHPNAQNLRPLRQMNCPRPLPNHHHFVQYSSAPWFSTPLAASATFQSTPATTLHESTSSSPTRSHQSHTQAASTEFRRSNPSNYSASHSKSSTLSNSQR